MKQQNSIKIFEDSQVRTAWDAEDEQWYFSIIDVCQILTDSNEPKRYWSDLKRKLAQEGNETYEKIVRLKMPAADGKMRQTDVATQEQLFRLIQSIPSPKAEPFKLWMAEVASQRLDQIQDPELSIEQAMSDYRRLGYSEEWINQRLKTIEVRKGLTDEWKERGVEEGIQYATLTDIITRQWSGLSTKEYKQYKGLKKENLRDNMSNVELALNMLAEASTTEISKKRKPRGMDANKQIAREGGNVARVARKQLEDSIEESAISPLNAKQLTDAQAELGLKENDIQQLDNDTKG